jgi:hypothetical protein
MTHVQQAVLRRARGARRRATAGTVCLLIQLGWAFCTWQQQQGPREQVSGLGQLKRT